MVNSHFHIPSLPVFFIFLLAMIFSFDHTVLVKLTVQNFVKLTPKYLVLLKFTPKYFVNDVLNLNSQLSVASV